MIDTIAVSNQSSDLDGPIQSNTQSLLRTFLVSMAALYFELLIIRYIGTEVRIFAYLKNITFIAGFCGIGIGMILPADSAPIENLYPLAVCSPLSLCKICSGARVNSHRVFFAG